MLTDETAKYLAAKWRYKIADALRSNGSIGRYSLMSRFTKGLGGQVQAHHIFEVTRMTKFGFPNTDGAPSVILTDAEHKEIHKALIKYGSETAANMEQLWQAYVKAYKAHPDWLKAIASYFGK